MPSPRPVRSLSLRDFPSRSGSKRKAADIPPRAKQLVRLMTWGSDDGALDAMTIEAAAVFMGIQLSTATFYFRLPKARQYYLQLLEELRDRERARNMHAAIGIRDDNDMKASPAGNKVRIEAAKFIEGRDGGISINNTVTVANQVTPGYIIDVGGHMAEVNAILDAAKGRRGGTVIEAHPQPELSERPGQLPPVESMVEGRAPGISRRAPEFGRRTEERYPPLDSRWDPAHPVHHRD